MLKPDHILSQTYNAALSLIVPSNQLAKEQLILSMKGVKKNWNAW